MKILFIGFNHRINDPRLFHRQMSVLKANVRNVELFYLTQDALYELTSYFDESGMALGVPDPVCSEHIPIGSSKQLISELQRLSPDIIQASDARELIPALKLRLFTGAKVIYDAHEDYFNQIFEFSGKTPRAFRQATKVAAIEFLLSRFCRAVFCTDDFLLTRYSKPLYGCRNVRLLRNFPLSRAIAANKPAYVKKNTLDLVYVGSVNKHRGIIDCAEYVARFNERYGPDKNLTFTVYSARNPIIDDLVNQQLIHHIPWLDYAELMRQLSRYDVGICLWHRSKKFERNLPLKNFDYMAAGLPIITSNFGNLEKYARMSGGAICIDPMDYNAFEAAILELFAQDVRCTLGTRGQAYIQGKASFETEAAEYVNTMIRSVGNSRDARVQKSVS